MAIQVGDTVRFLNAQGGGVVSKILSKELVEVTDTDGFDVPTLVSECVVVETAAEKKRQKNEPEDDTFRFSKKNTNIVTEKNEKEKEPEETPEGNDINVMLAFLPINIKMLSTTDYEAYLINDSNYYIAYNIACGNGNIYYSHAAGVIEPNTKIFLEEIKKEQLNDLEETSVQLIAFKKAKSYSIRPAYDTKLKINPVKFYKFHSFSENEYFDEEAMVFPIVKNNELCQRLNISPADLNEIIQSKETKLPARVSKKTPTPSIIEVDLHINKLLDNTRGMGAKEMLDHQISVFHDTLRKYAKNKGQKIVFIHGKGEGVLRKEILTQLKQKYPSYTSQDASFQEYGYGATLVTVK